jgi:hypothetical protein
MVDLAPVERVAVADVQAVTFREPVLEGAGP